MLDRIYAWFHRVTAKPQERGEYSSGVWQELIRAQALAWCGGLQGWLLEVGCGEGLFLDAFCQNAPQVQAYGVDMSRTRVEQARNRLAGKKAIVSVEDATGLSFGADTFDAAVCVNVFFNMPDLFAVRQALAEINRVCRPGARIIVDFRNAGNPFLRLKYKLAPWYDPTVKSLPLRTYRLQQMKAMMAEIGLLIEEMTPIGSAGLRWAPIIMLKARKP